MEIYVDYICSNYVNMFFLKATQTNRILQSTEN